MKKKTNRKPRRYLRSFITRKLILDTAQEIFLTNGYAKTTIIQISKKATVGYGTVYSHFKGKEDLLIKVVDRLLEDLYLLLDTPSELATCGEAREMCLQIIETSFHLMEQHRPTMRVFQEALAQSDQIRKHHQAVLARFRAALTGLIASTEPSGPAIPVDLELSAKASVLLIDCFLWEIVQDREKDTRRLAASLTAMLFEGFFTRPARD